MCGGMLDTMETWKKRLQAVIKRQGRSMREVSISAGLSDGYLFTVFRTQPKPVTPTVDVLLKLCDTLGVSPSEILEGYKIDLKTETLLRTWAEMSDDEQTAVLPFLQMIRRNREKD